MGAGSVMPLGEGLAWVLLFAGVSLAAAMGFNPATRHRPVQLALALFALASASLVGNWDASRIYHACLVAAAVTIVLPEIAGVFARRLRGSSDVVGERTTDEPASLRLASEPSSGDRVLKFEDPLSDPTSGRLSA